MTTALYDAVKAAADARGIKIASIRTVRARWAIACPQCRVALPVGAEIAQPNTRNCAGGQVYIAVWYCPACAVKLAAQGPRVGGSWLSRADMIAHREWMATARNLIDALIATDAGSRADARAAEIKVWAAEHDSERLKAQIELGLPGWPLYLHERLDVDWPASVTGSVRAELDNDGEAGDPLVNPSLLQIKAAKAVAARAVELGLAADMDAAVGCVEIVPIEFAADVDEDGYCDGKPVTRTYVTFSNYRPGSKAFALKQIRFACEE